MTPQLSDEILERMGLKSMPPSQSLAAVFHSLRVYKIEGFTLEAPSLELMSGKVAGVPYNFSVGMSLNAVCQKLVGDDFTGSESEWQAKRKCNPPYLVVHIGSTTQHEVNISRAKEDDRSITTYDSFSAARAELDELENKVLPSLLSALACSFFTSDPAVRFLPIDRAVAGIARDGRTVHDFRIDISARMFVSSKLDPAQIEARLASGMKIASAMNSKVARFFHLALDEDDRLKKFLYFFLAIEVETHATFKKIDHAGHFSKLIAAPGRIATSTQDFFGGQHERWTNLRDRFLWCAVCVWHQLSDADIEEFKRLKAVRDDIAHGTIAVPPESAAKDAERLAKKLLLPP